ncbi:MAG: shikimate dehydrogenase [Alphaproteobacteria bacterium]|nr:shikimate dehydrogenase [Alphaproteobacteria bacterium]
MIRAAVIGHPVSHSKSPLIHNYWIGKYGLQGAYGALDIRPENLAQDLEKYIAEGYAGFNLTLPHKELVLPLCDEVDETARAVGAVNTIVVKGNKIKGRNTDVFGFLENIKQSAPGFDFRRGPALVLGAGGAARAAVYGLLQEGAPEIRIANRTKEKAAAMAADFKNVKTVAWEEKEQALKDISLLVNTTSLGMKGQPPLDMDLEDLNANALVNDIVYAPLETDLLKTARARGNQVVTGIGMLLHQARPAFREWFGVLPDVDAELMRRVLE